ncbi:hypothetical protein MJ923_07810 [Shewanella sp. 3B26]|uniref:Uncharacterized protein n=1 Tax=Shewanella zhuhaiensis TaxID=2919576 RepID=A0AAJ1BI20_9GAMM|nr:hypothetical protein [Shewanella zhuhaiensis]MCH4294209.1 hypothetical protein [Shewanella zhuhaiensis]
MEKISLKLKLTAVALIGIIFHPVFSKADEIDYDKYNSVLPKSYSVVIGSCSYPVFGKKEGITLQECKDDYIKPHFDEYHRKDDCDVHSGLAPHRVVLIEKEVKEGQTAFYVAREYCDDGAIQVYNSSYAFYRAWTPTDAKSCPPDEFIEYTHGRDVDGDGQPDQCYNPNDFVRAREKVPTVCDFETAYSLSSDDEAKLKKAAEDALKLLEEVESDLRSPNSTNSCRLNGLAQLIGVPDYTSTHFLSLSKFMLKRSSSIKNELNKLVNDVTGTRSPRYLVTDNEIALKYGFVGSHCRASNKYPFIDNEIVFADYILSSYNGNISFFNKGVPDLRKTLIHEIHHSKRGVHEKNRTLEWHYDFFNDDLNVFRRLVENPKFGSDAFFERFTRNPYHYIWMLEAMKCS